MNKYEILGIVGEGAYGIVYKAKNKETGEFVAIKKFKESAEEDQIVKKTTKREVKMLSVLKDKSVVRMIEAFKRKGKLYLVFEFMDRNLLEVLEEKPDGLDRDSVKYFIYQLLKAVDYFHSQNVMHRDIKPENLLICSKTNELKVCDFGFARHLNNKSDIHSSSNKSQNGKEDNTGTNSPELTDYVATRWYRSPELLLVSDQLPYGKEVDIWAVGCIMGELMDGQPLFPGDSEVDQLFVIQKVLGKLPDFLQEEFNRNTRYQGLKFPEITHPETLEARYAPVMNDIEIELMKKMLDMDPYQRITARQAIEHDYFDDLRAKDPEYNGGEEKSSQNGSLNGQESAGNLLGGNKRILSPELLNQRQRAGQQSKGQSQERGANNFNLTNKNSYSHASNVEATRRSDNNYNVSKQNTQGSYNKPENAMQNLSTGGSNAAGNANNSSQQNMIMLKSNNSGSNFMNLSAGGDPLHQSKQNGTKNQYMPNMNIQNLSSPMSNNYYQSNNQMRKNSKNSKNTQGRDQDYNYNINIEKYGSSGGNQSQPAGTSSGPGNNPLLASVHTQGSLKATEKAKTSGVSNGSHGGSAINLQQKKDGVKGEATGQPNHNNRVGSINSNPGSTASRGSKYNIHQQQNQNTQQIIQNHNLQSSQSPPSVRNKIVMHKITKNSNQKQQNPNNTKKSHQNQYTMYQSNHLPMTSQQSRRKSQVSINNMINQNIDPLQAMPINYNNGGMPMNQMQMQQMGPMAMMNGQNFVSGMSDTGAAPDNSGGSSMMNMMSGGSSGMQHPMQMYQSNFTGSSLAQYNNNNGLQVNQQFSSQDKKRSKQIQGAQAQQQQQQKGQGQMGMRFQMDQNFEGQQFVGGGTHHNMPMSSNAVLHHDNWREENGSNSNTNGSLTGPPGSHYKVGGSKMKLGAATSSNFMKNQNNNNQQYNMSMLRSVQQNMPNMPNEYNYKIPAVASQSKIISGGSGSGGVGAPYRGNQKKFVMSNTNQMQMVAEINSRSGNHNGPNSLNGGQRPQRAATQGGHIFGGQIGRGHAYAQMGQMGSKLNKIQVNQQKFANSNLHDNSLSNGYLMTNSSHGNHGSPKYNSKSKYFSNQAPIMNMKFPTTSHGNRSSTNHNTQYHSSNHHFNGSGQANMQNVLGNIQKHI